MNPICNFCLDILWELTKDGSACVRWAVDGIRLISLSSDGDTPVIGLDSFRQQSINGALLKSQPIGKRTCYELLSCDTFLICFVIEPNSVNN